jgi:hypothetical protein
VEQPMKFALVINLQTVKALDPLLLFQVGGVIR